MLWLASAAGASTIPYASIWERWEAGWVAWDEWSASFGQTSVERYARPDGPWFGNGNPSYGRRSFRFHRNPIVLPNRYIPVEWSSWFDPYEDVQVSPGPDQVPQPNQQYFARSPWLGPIGWEVPPPSDAYDPVPIFYDGGGATLIRGGGIDLTRVDASPLLISFRGIEQGPSFGGRVEWPSDRFHFSLDDFYEASTAPDSMSAPVVAVPVPEPGAGVLLLVGLCALAAGRRLR